MTGATITLNEQWEQERLKILSCSFRFQWIIVIDLAVTISYVSRRQQPN
jgi:hypothetical protein